MNDRDRLWVAILLVAAVLAGLATVAFASVACPAATPSRPCDAATFNRGVVIALASLTVGLAVTALAWLAAFRRRRIAYRGFWLMAGRRGVLAAAALAALAALRLGDALNVLSAAVVLGAAVAIEWALVRGERG